MNHKSICTALAALLLLGMAGCGAADVRTVQATNLTAEIQPQILSGAAADAEFLTAQTGFALALMQKTVSASSGENVLISPYSVMQTLAMAANGADGDTLAEMEQTLGGIPIDMLDQYLYTQRTTMPEGDGAKLHTANSVWFRDDADRIAVLPDFLQRISDAFSAEAYTAPFDETTRSDINSWCSEQTDGMVPVLLNEPISADAVMYLINAVCFDAKWRHPYEDEPRSRDFTAYDGTVQQAQMMYAEEHGYLEDAHATGFLKYYQGDYAFAALLPEEGMTPEEYLSGLTAESLRQLLINNPPREVHTGLPQFSYDFEIKYNSILSEMGMPGAFTEDADFTRMAETASGALFISLVLHKTHIDVDTEGTRAAAVTAAVMTDGAASIVEEPKFVILDRPFVYMIVETKTMLPVFFGVLNQIPQ